jgi:hypothetical protein
VKEQLTPDGILLLGAVLAALWLGVATLVRLHGRRRRAGTGGKHA